MYKFQWLLFGLSNAPQVFTKLLKPISTLLRQRGLHLILYLDDMLLMAQSKVELRAFVKLVPQLLQLFNINWDKSVLSPTQRIQFLGFMVNSIEMSISLPREKVTKIRHACRPRYVQCLLTGMGSTTRRLEACGPTRNDPCTRTAWSSWGAGAFTVKTFTKHSQKFHIRLQMDSTTAVAYTNRMGGTHSSTLSNMACSLWQWCLQRGITLSAEHFPKIHNTTAEAESQIFHSSAE